MLAVERRRAIAARVSGLPAVRTDDLAEEFGVSAETIRRDLLELERVGLVERVHGGATTAERPRALEASHVSRQVLHLDGKRAIARAAARLVEPGHTLIIDVGTTAIEVARALPATWHGRVLTNSLPVAVELAGRPDVEVLTSGGRVRPGDLACAGRQAVDFFDDLYADLAFLGSGGVHAQAGLTDYHLDEVDVRRVMVERAARSYVLADASKLGVIAARRVCALERLAGLITDAAPPPDLAEALALAGVDVVVGGA